MQTNQSQSPAEPAPPKPGWSWRRIVTLAGLLVLGITPWASAQLPPPNMPAYCPPLTSIANPSLFDVFWGTTPIRYPYQ
ncbi:MAG TPA: hypothetical protein VMV94_21770 [Phycisphaerae bacterium]|nr:hypothetical protein [Phycisphaerae bacterium]